MPRALIEQVEANLERENLVFDDKDWMVIPGGVDQKTNWLPQMAGVYYSLQEPPMHPSSMHVHIQGSISYLEPGHASYSDSEGNMSHGEESYNNEIAYADEWVPENEEGANSDEENIPPLMGWNHDTDSELSEDESEEEGDANETEDGAG